jgi:hypothetical protein
MTVADQVLKALRSSSAGLSDAELAALLGRGHQHINQTCRTLADQGLIVRGTSLGSITNRLATVAPPRASDRLAVARPVGSVDYDWAWEGNVQSSVVTQLAATGWRIVAVADTVRRQQGADIVAERDGTRLQVEVKGWPSTTYARGDRAGRPKPTQPSLQAMHWVAEGLTTLIRRGADLSTKLALALPDMPRYRTLLAEAGWAIQRLEITIYLVEADGAVRTWEPES